MRIQLNSSSRPRSLPHDHVALDRYIDPNCCTLDNTVQQLSIDRPDDEPWIVWLSEVKVEIFPPSPHSLNNQKT